MTGTDRAGHAPPADAPLWEWQASRQSVIVARVVALVGLPVALPLVAVGVAGTLADNWLALILFLVSFVLAVSAMAQFVRSSRCQVWPDCIVITTVFGEVRQWAPSEIGWVKATRRVVWLRCLRLRFWGSVSLPLDESQREALREVLARIGGPPAEDWLFLRHRGLSLSYEWGEGPGAAEQNGAAPPPPPLPGEPLAEWRAPEQAVKGLQRAPVYLVVLMLTMVSLLVLVKAGARQFWPELWWLMAAGGGVVVLAALGAMLLPYLLLLFVYRRVAVYPDRVVLERIIGPTRELLLGDIALAELRRPASLRLRLRPGWLRRRVSVGVRPSVARRLFEALEQLGVPTRERKA